MITKHPILFSGPMVRAILEGRKTQTRRIVKGRIQPWDGKDSLQECKTVERDGTGHGFIFWKNGLGSAEFTKLAYPDGGWQCPYGKPKDLLWVREEHYRYGHWEEVPGVRTKGGRQKWKFVADTGEVLYEPPVSFRKGRHHKDPFTPAWHKRLARFMPRWASRITLEAESIRVERLQEISEEDAMAEGIIMHEATLEDDAEFSYMQDGFVYESAKEAYRYLWESINGPGSWDANPWVWAVNFKRIKP